ncbi:hypothetical protein F5Y16DRAFT_108892 [Xylariaceae sp. FL0255]|nr:hypothetical protein F5Y16DRAFT_108892 [Xylariaceae sp. FL0255]
MAQSNRSDSSASSYVPYNPKDRSAAQFECEKRRKRSKRTQSKPKAQCWLSQMLAITSLRRCAVKGCTGKRWSKHGSSSQFCRRHKCKDKHCTSRIKKGKIYCQPHLTCAYSNCRWDKHAQDIEKFIYCWESHACRADNCENVRREPFHRNQFCAHHACESSDKCNNPRNDLGGKVCPHHKCRDHDCMAKVKGTRDPRDAKELNWCSSHKMCQSGNCKNPIFTTGGNPAGKYCSQHFCNISGICDKPRVTGADATACEDHTCLRYRGRSSCCKVKKDPGGGVYCEDHECKNITCTDERLGDREWCYRHACHAYTSHKVDCKNEKEGTPQNPDHCKDHVECEDPGCKEYCNLGENAQYKKCEKHRKIICNIPGCEAEATNPPINPTLCNNHVCAFGHCCEAHLITSFFCPSHKCISPSCNEPRAISNDGSASSLGLALLSGGLLGTATAQLNLTQVLMPVGLYCAKHVCGVRGCQNIGAGRGREGDENYCTMHKCHDASGRCDNRIVGETGAYCVVHKCANKDCNAARDPDDGGEFCHAHADNDDWDFWNGANVAGYGKHGKNKKNKYMYPPLQW